MKLIKPPKLEKGDTIAFVAPASGLAKLIPHRMKIAINFFEDRGYKVKVYPTATKMEGLSSDSAENRAKDIMDAFQDKEVKGIITTIGGNSCHQILEYLDFDIIKNNPKIFCGYSDITSLHFAFMTKANLMTFYGPAAVVEFGEELSQDEYSIEYFFKATTDLIGKVDPSKLWTDDKIPDWLSKKDLEIKRTYKKNKGFEWLKTGRAQGKIVGGCITSMMHTKGTKYWPDFTDKILLLETPEGNDFRKGEPIEYIDAYLADLRINGTFDKIKGMVFGKGFGYDEEQVEQLKEAILDNTRNYDFPIVYGVNVGHADPIITVPLGSEVIIDSDLNLFEFLESGVRD